MKLSFWGLAVLLLIVVNPSWSENASSGLHCFDRGTQIEVIVRNQSEGLDFFAWSAKGIEGWPLYQGVVTKDALRFIQFQLEDLKDMPWHVQLRWPKGSCKVTTEGLFLAECFGPSTALVEFPYESNSLVIYRVQDSSVSNEYKSYRLSWSVTTPATTYFLGFVFYDPLCSPL